MIFTDDAPKLESALHRAFEDRKVNMINHRREFFHVTLEEIKEVIRQNFDKTVEFHDIPDADQYRQSIKLLAQKGISLADPQPKTITSTSYAHQTQHKPVPREPKSRTDIPKAAPAPYTGEILYTKWGNYEMPSPCRIDFTRGPRKNLQKI